MARNQFYLFIVLLVSASLALAEDASPNSSTEELQRKPEFGQGQQQAQPQPPASPAPQTPDNPQQLEQPQQLDQQQQVEPTKNNQVPAGPSDTIVVPEQGLADEFSSRPSLFDMFMRPRPFPNRRPSLFDVLDGGVFDSMNQHMELMDKQMRRLEQQAGQSEGQTKERFWRNGVGYTRTCVVRRDS